MLTGSTAMLKYSVYRYTADIDVVIECEINDARGVIEIFEPDYYVPLKTLVRERQPFGKTNNQCQKFTEKRC